MHYRSLFSLSLAALATTVTAVPWNDGKKPAPPTPPGHGVGKGKGNDKKPWISTKALMDQVYLSDLEEGAYVLQGIADRFNNTRAIGTPGHEATLQYIENTLIRTGAFDITKQSLETYRYTTLSNSTAEINGQVPEFATPDFSPAGTATGNLIYAGIGCEASEFPSPVSGQIALVDRGTCEFGLKVALAGSAGATGIIIVNNEEATPDVPPSAVTLGEPTRPEGDFVPAIAVSLNYGASIREGASGTFTVNSETALITTYNIIAETKTGDHTNVITVGAHTDSVTAGPGVNDDGSGTIAILKVAEKFSQYSHKNAVRFCFWTAEEVGLVGSTHYVESLSQKEVEKIRLNLNFDMLASPNYIYMIFDGDGDAFGLTGPTGSSQIEKLFQDYFDARNTPYNATAFDGRSDYGPFLDVNIPAGGLFTGAEEIKTEADVAKWGGIVGESYDQCYHKACDDVNNLAFDAWLFNTKAVAYAIATYSESLAGFPANNATAIAPTKKRSFARRAAHTHAGTSPHGHGRCGPKTVL